jgi:hypothetical protein
MALANLFMKTIIERLVEEIENVKRSFKTPLQAI